MSKINLNIEADTPEEFRKILLAILGNVNVTNVAIKSDDPDRVAAKLVESAKPAASKPAAKPKAAEKPAEPAPDVEDTGKTVTEVKATNGAATEPEKPAEKPKKAAKKEPEQAADAGAQPAPELPDHIKNTNSMRDLLTYLAEHGVDSADAMVATCTVLKKEVPILSKVPNVEDRVRRALDVLALFPEGDAAQA